MLVWSRTPENCRAFAQQCSRAFGFLIEAVDSAEQAVQGAHIVITATSSRDPLLEAEWVSPGAHVNAAGSNQPTRRELPAELVHRAGLIAVDSIEQARIQSGDLLLALDQDDWEDARIVELADLVSGKLERHHWAGSTTIFKSNGLGVEDVAAAAFLFRSGHLLLGFVPGADFQAAADPAELLGRGGRALPSTHHTLPRTAPQLVALHCLLGLFQDLDRNHRVSSGYPFSSHIKPWPALVLT